MGREEFKYYLLTFLSALREVNALIASLLHREGKRDRNFKSGKIKCHKEYSNTFPHRSGITFQYPIKKEQPWSWFRFGRTTP